MVSGFAKIFLIPLMLSTGTAKNYTYKLGGDSWLQLSGTSSINSFECISLSESSGGHLVVTPNGSDTTLNFSSAVLNLRVKSFDCMNPRLNRDMHSALGVDQYPMISIELLEVITSGRDNQNGSGSIDAVVSIRLNGQTKVVEIPVKWMAEGAYKYRFTGGRALKMSDFGIAPPSPMFGLIRVSNEINISFSLSVSVEEV